MIVAAPTSHIRLDKSGVAWIDDTNVKVIEVIGEHLAHGEGAEEIHLQHRHLSLAQLHSAFAYYFDHRDELEAEIERRLREAEALRAKAGDQPSLKELIERLNQQRRDERQRFGEARLRKLCPERGLNWDLLPENEREEFVNRLLHEGK